MSQHHSSGIVRYSFRWTARLLATSAVIACCPAPPVARPAAQPAPAAPSLATPSQSSSQDRLVEDFEHPEGRSGPFAFEFDKNSLGTVANPSPFTLTPGGAPGSSGASAHIWGTLGTHKAPWPWAQLHVHLNRTKSPEDLRSFHSLRFFAKGDGGRYQIEIVKAAVTDYDHFRYDFIASTGWTEIKVPLEAFRQAGWGKPVPPTLDDVIRIQFSPTDCDHSFDLFVDHVVLSPASIALEAIPYDTQDWYVWPGIDPVKRRGTALDVRRLLNAPAGKHGPLGKKGEDFVFRDGTKVRFFGNSFTGSANFPSHAEAEKLAEVLAELGVNIIRHHHLDAAWAKPNVFGNGPTTRQLDATAMDRLDYFVHQLEQRGIYQLFELLNHRLLTPADGISNSDKLAPGLLIEGEFDPKLLELQEQYIDQFMGHKNPYTNHTYAQDPAVALVQATTHHTLFWIEDQGEFSFKTPQSRAMLNGLFSKWLNRKVPGGRTALESRWKGTGQGLKPDEDPRQENVNAVVSVPKGQDKNLTAARAKDTLEFYHDTMLAHFRRIEARLRKLGYRGLVTGSDHWSEHPLDQIANAEVGFLNRPSHWALPQGGYGYVREVSWDPNSMVKDADLGIVGSLALRRMKGVPYVSEWQSSGPNDFRHEAILLVGAYASLQGLNPIQYAFSHNVDKSVSAPSTFGVNFDIINQPAQLAGWPAAALLFHRGDVRPSDIDAYVGMDSAARTAAGATLPKIRQLSLIARTGFKDATGPSVAELETLRNKYIRAGVVTSSTGELRHDAAHGRFEVDTPRSQGTVAFSSAQPILLSNVRIKLESPFAVVIVSTLDDLPLSSSKHWLITALGNAVHTGMTLKPGRGGFVDPGTSPILVEPIRGNVTLTGLKGSLDGAHAWALSASGERGKEVALTKADSSLGIAMSAAHQTMHYELVR